LKPDMGRGVSKRASGTFVAEGPQRARRARTRNFVGYKITSNPSSPTIVSIYKNTLPHHQQIPATMLKNVFLKRSIGFFVKQW
jgi:hypothetical protein